VPAGATQFNRHPLGGNMDDTTQFEQFPHREVEQFLTAYGRRYREYVLLLAFFRVVVVALLWGLLGLIADLSLWVSVAPLGAYFLLEYLPLYVRYSPRIARSNQEHSRAPTT
jgi:hypothetical protein